MAHNHIEIYGHVEHLTPKAVLFRISGAQPAELPQGAMGIALWFPRRRCVLFKEPNGVVGLSVNRQCLLEKVASVQAVCEHRTIAACQRRIRVA